MNRGAKFGDNHGRTGDERGVAACILRENCCEMSEQSISKLKSHLDALRSRDMSNMGYEAKVLHARRIEEIEQMIQLAERGDRAQEGSDCESVRIGSDR